ncbi:MULTISPECIES: energy transducer TonB [unclassified Sphingomonas]|uniref:energy transducer TonB n=1 Tax=unclassified Sphingomonas TaxID=196159 RepID=UPI000700864F|nr:MULTISPECIES: energy transducer TonB [unclassified Sphingomonas]KQX22711.1 energy transducer TonB [Sphingomonas sp. Root1294]KQY67808.1 energy transducer TonB [Sphingomonas sp. Root50]KRB88732.1 energy transducer TonB [Sphingomonas sp. Root720]
MHATLERGSEAESDALYFADLPDARESATVPPPIERSVYGANRNPNWPTIIAIVALHVVTLYGLVTFDVIHIAEKKKPLVVELIAEPPAPPAEKPKPEPVVIEKVQPIVLAPPPIVQTLAPPPPITVTTAPPPPKQTAVAAPPPAGPVTVGNLDERLLEGNPPRYPMESRRKHEQGTVVVRLLISTDGRVSEISIAQSSGFERLDKAALQAIRGWRWQPIVRDGQPVEVRGLYSMPFTLNG